jgi:hypothetical protein
MLEIYPAKTLKSGNPQINFIIHRGIVIHLCCHHLQALSSSTTIPVSSCHQGRNQALVVQPMDIRVMGNHGHDRTSPKENTVNLNCSLLSNSHDRGRHLQVHLECRQHRLESFQSISRHLPSLLHRDKFLAHLGDLPLASQRNNFSQLRNRTGQMLQGLRICLHR